VFGDVRESSLVRADGRTVAWTECGPVRGVPLLRIPGTPGARLSLRADRTPWIERGLRVITTERPGFGASTPLPDRGFREHADDSAAILDHLDLDRVYVTGASGAAPHELAFAARHPERVRAMTIVAGAAPLADEDVASLITVNRDAYRLVRSGDRARLRDLLDKQRAALMEDPLAAMEQVMAVAPEADKRVMADPAWQHSFAVAVREALRQGIDGWMDETVAIDGTWEDVDLSAITTTLTWWHSPRDANAPLAAVRRLLTEMPSARLELFGDDEGHLAGYHREGGILDELLARG
jgi:pimeloyl-ACP methyl ester carboxylesterase